MKLCLAIAFQNEANWLRLHLPVLVHADVDGLVGLDGGSHDDSAAVVHSHVGSVHKHHFNYHWGDHMNALIEAARSEGFDAVLRLDPDELMFPGHINQVRSYLKKFSVLRFPRINFEVDRCHWCKQLWPDYQARAFCLDKDIYYVNRVHELLSLPANTTVKDVKEWPIFHYEGIKPGPERQLKGINYWRLEHGLEPLKQLLPNTPPFEPRPHEPFLQPQPIHPLRCGAHAPLEELVYAV